MKVSEEITVKNLFDLKQSICGSYLEKYQYPWEILPDIEKLILTIEKTLSKDKFEYVGNQIWIAKTAEVAESVCLNGPLIVDEGAQIRHGAFIRGRAVIGKGAVVGNSTELKNCILFDAVEVPHFNYIGDSILGFHAHLGAGAITSNVKADRSEIRIHVSKDGGTQGIESGLKKMGAMLGDYVEVGCNSVLNPGTVIGRNTIIYPLLSVRGYVEKDSIMKHEKNVIKKS